MGDVQTYWSHEICKINWKRSGWLLYVNNHYCWSFERKTYTWSSRKSSHSMKSGGFHTDFMKSGRFHMDFTKSMKSGRFHLWNPADFTKISPVKSTQNYKSKCFSKNSSVWWMQGGGFHPWNPVDFTLKSGGFHLWNLVDFTQISPVKSTQNYKSKCFSKNSSVWWMQGGGYDQGFHPWNLADFTQISPVKSTQIIKASVSAKTLQFDECRVGAMTKDFMKSTRFHPEIWQIWPVKSSGFHPDITCEIHPKL